MKPFKNNSYAQRTPGSLPQPLLGIWLFVWMLIATPLLSQERVQTPVPSESALVPLPKTESRRLVKQFTRNNPLFAVPFGHATTEGVIDVVPKEWVIEAVKQKAATRFTRFTIGTPIPCCDTDGKLSCYQVPVAIAKDSFPEHLTPPPAGEILQEDIKRQELWGIGEYWTFVVSARQSRYPIYHHHQGLPAFLVTFHKATEVAQDALKERDVRFERYYSLGHAGDFFEFVNSHNNPILVNAHTLKVRTKPPSEPVALKPDSEATSETPQDKQKGDQLRRTYDFQTEKAWEVISKAVSK